jgi:hypothetical protein
VHDSIMICLVLPNLSCWASATCALAVQFALPYLLPDFHQIIGSYIEYVRWNTGGSCFQLRKRLDNSSAVLPRVIA